MREQNIKGAMKEIVPNKYHNYAGVGEYYIPLLGKMFWNRHRKAIDITPMSILKEGSYTIGDMGSGFGVFATLCGNSFPKSKIIGLDVYPVDILVTSRAISNKCNVQNASFIRGDLCKLPFSDKKFDILFALDVLEHIPDALSALYECKRVLKEDGILIISVPVESKILRFLRCLYAVVKPINTNPHWHGAIKSFQAFHEHLLGIFKVERKSYFPINVFGASLNYDCFFVCRNQ